jgi:hypothetical protein
LGVGADHAWQYAAIVTAPYIISHGIMKADISGHDKHTD